MRKLFKFKYPKILGLIIAILLAYVLFSNASVQSSISKLKDWSYFGAFIGGIFFTFGFTSPLAAGLFITLDPENIWLAAVIAGFGAMLGDLLIFQFIRVSFMHEFEMLKREKISNKLAVIFRKTIFYKIKVYLTYVFAGILIASPLPDEAGIIMLAGITDIKPRVLSIIGFTLNTLGILVLLCL